MEDKELDSISESVRVLIARQISFDNGTQENNPSNDEICLAAWVLMEEAHRYISEKVKNPDRWPIGMRALRGERLAYLMTKGNNKGR